MAATSHLLSWILLSVLPLVVTSDDQGRSNILVQTVELAQQYYNYLKSAPPNYDNTDEPVVINVLLYVSSIDAVNEANMDFTVGFFLHLSWEDDRIIGSLSENMFQRSKLDVIDFDADRLSMVWVPDIFFPNEKDGNFHAIMAKNQMMRLYKDGILLYIARMSLTLSCPMNLHNYPFDKQVCHLIIMSFGYSEQDVKFQWTNSPEPNSESSDESSIRLSEDIKLPQFEVKQVIPSICHNNYHQKRGNHSCIQADFYLERNIGFYIVQMYIPSMLIVMLSWISFWLTVSSVPGRISLGLLTVLTMTTQSSSVNAALPRVSYTKAIDVWMSTCLVFVFAALLEFAVVNVLSRMESIRGFSFKHVFSIPQETDGGRGVKVNEVSEVSIPLDGYGGDKKRRRFMERGIVYATYLDIAARIFFPLSFAIFIMVYWLYYFRQ